MSEIIKGIIHVHSDFSSDGVHSVADLAEFARESCFRFVGLTDHAEDLSPQDMECFRKECDANSDQSCVMIPGLEFRCDGDIHILGLGIGTDIPTTEPIAVANHIRRLEGLAILAHPCRNGYQCPDELCHALNGIEIWNEGYDGRFVPPVANLRLLQEARSANPNVSGFGGADLHAFHRPPGVVIEIRANGVDRVNADTVLRALRTGEFSVCGRYLNFDPNAVPRGLPRVYLWAFRKLYEITKAVRDVALGEI